MSASLLADGFKTREALRWFGSESNEDMRFPDSLGPSLDIVLRAKESGIVTRLEVADALASIAADFSMFGSIPPELVTLLIQLANISGGESVYTPWDRTAQLASRAIQLSPSVVLETPRSTNLPVWLSILSERPFEVKFSDPITRPSATEGGKLRKFDVSVTFPPMGFKVAVDAVAQDWFTRFPEQTASGTVLAIRHALSQCNRRAVIAVPSNTLFSDGVEQALRKDLVQSGIVESVINMPSGLLNSTRLPFAILVLDPRGGHSQVRFIDADHPDFTEPEPKGRRVRLAGLESILTLLTSYVESDHAATVDIAEILNSDGLLMVNRYVLPPDKKRVFDLIRRRNSFNSGR